MKITHMAKNNSNITTFKNWMTLIHANLKNFFMSRARCMECV